MSTFIRRPFLASKTDVAIISQPTIRGTVHIDVNGEITGVNDAISGGATEFQIAFRTESEPRVEVSFTSVSALTLLQIVDGINTAAGGLSPVPLYAYSDAGVLRVDAANSGATGGVPSFIEVLPADAGYVDLAPLIGFAVSPHPSAKVTAGDLASTSPRAMTQGNRPLSSFIARGEDRTSESFNRALHSLAKNLDNHQVKLGNVVAVPVVLEIPSGSARFVVDPTTGEITAVDLRSGFVDALDGVLATDTFVGASEGYTASLQNIAKYFSVLDSEWKEILADSEDGTATVGIGTVAYAPTGSSGGLSTFNSDGSSDTALAVSSVFNSYRNALGSSSTKQASVGVTRIIDGATIVCDSASFVTDLVEPGDIVEISGALDESPTTNNGTYLVDAVISEKEIIIRPADPDDLRILNEATGESLVIRSNGVFENSLYMWFEPRLPRVPAGGIKLVLGMKSELGTVPRDFLLIPAVSSAEEVDGWVLEHLHRNLNLDGAYRGQGQGNGGGFFAEITGRPITLHMNPETHAPTVVLTGTGGSIRAGNIFVAPSDVTFSTEHVGHSIYLTVGAVVYSDWRIFRVLDARTVELVPPTSDVGNELPTGAVTSFQTYSGTWKEYRAAVSVVTEYPNAGGFHHTKMNNSSTSGVLSFAHLEHLTRSAKISDGTIRGNLALLTGGFTSGVGTGIVDSTTASVDLDDLWSVYPGTYGSGAARERNSHGGKTLISFVSGTVRSGPYLLYSTQPAGIEVVNLDGSAVPELTGTLSFQILTLRVGVGAPIDRSGVTSAITAYQDAAPDAGSSTRTVGLRAGWTGNGNGVLITANDASFVALGASVGTQHVSRGYAMYVTAFAPADGIYVGVSSSDAVESRATGLHIDADTHGNSFDPPNADGSPFTTGSSKSAGALFTQIGSDPAAVLIKKDGSATATAENLRLTPSATVVVARATQGSEPAITGVGSAIETVGSIWVRSAAADSANGSALGGIFSEDVVGAGRYLQPIWGTDPTQHEGYSWSESAFYWQAPPTLGRPGQILPILDALPDPEAEVLEADFAKFNIPHAGILQAAVSGALLPVSKYVGCIIEITESGHPQEGGRYSIVAASGDGTDVFFALAGATPISSAVPVSFKLHGLRWHRSYLDIADWFQIGTANGLKTLDRLPLIASDPNLLESRVSSDLDHSRSNPNLSATPWSPAVEGAGLGAAENYSIPGPTKVDVEAETEWTGTAEGPHLSTQWSKFSNEPRPPFYGDATAANPVTTSFTLADLIHVPGPGSPVDYRNFFGGVVKVSIHSIAAQTLRQRGRRYIWSDHLRVRVNIRATARGSEPVTANIALVTEGGSVLATGSISITAFPTLNEMQLQSSSVLLTQDKTYDRASDALSSSRKDEELELRIVFPGAVSTPEVFLQEITTAQETDPAYVSGHQVVSGHVMAHGFRHFNPVRGYQTVGPAEAALLGGDDYGVNMGWSKDVAAGVEISPPTSVFSSGMQELRGGVGLIRTSGRGAIDGWRGAVRFLENGYDPAAAVAVHTELNATYTSGVLIHDGADDFDAANSAYDALIASPGLALFNEFLFLCIEVAEESYDRGISALRVGVGTIAQDKINSAEALKDLALAAIDALDAASETKLTEAFQNKVVDKWLRPYVDLYRLFNVGVNSATVTLYNGVYDPLWYAMQANALYNDTPFSGTNPISRDTFIPCGSVGFIVPIDPPHGAVLTTLSISLSFRPSSPGHWGIYFGEPDSFYESTPLFTDVADAPAWAAKEGVAVELWRFNTVDIGEDEPYLARWTDHVPEYGFGERLARTEVSLADADSSTMFTENLIPGSWNPPGFGSSTAIKAGREWLKKTTINLQSSAVEDSDLRVDRRVYSYAVVVRFNGGPRYYSNSTGKYLPHGPGEVTNSTLDAAFDQPARFYQIRQPVLGTDVTDTPTALAFEFGRSLLNKTIYAYRDPGPRVEGEERWAPEGALSRADYAYPPQVKFRGARVGWVTDRAGDKGWG